MTPPCSPTPQRGPKLSPSKRACTARAQSSPQRFLPNITVSLQWPPPAKRSPRQLSFCQATADHVLDNVDDQPVISLLPCASCQHQHSAAASASAVPEDVAGLDDWVAYARGVDERSCSVIASEARLQRAVMVEDYTAAAKAQAELRALQRQDCLADVVQQQAAAVAADDFAAAAALRDASQQNLTGWWAATNSGSDPWSHVIRVTEGYSRLEARAFSPAHLADVMGWGKETPFHRPFGNKSYDDVGVPYFEVLLRRDAAGNLERQHFVLPDSLTSDDQLAQSLVGLYSPAPVEASPSPPPPPPPPPLPPRVKPAPSLWEMLMNRKSAVAKARGDGVPSGRGALKPSEHNQFEAAGGLSSLGMKGQLAPRRVDQAGPSLREAYEKLQQMDALAAMTELEERTALSLAASSSAAPLERTRRPCSVTLVDRNHFRVTLPPLSPGGSPRTIDYARLEHDLPTTDPLTGYYLGSFGVHGPELLLLQRGLWEGEEAVIAHKVTGDPNVPAGQVSFRAKVGAGRGLSVAAYPAPLSVSQRFAGEGCVAERGFIKSRWADGELLAFGGPGNGKLQRLTGNAELGFIWSMAHSKRFLILLSRVNFSMPTPLRDARSSGAP